jgi:hypothetical protein
MVLFAYRNLFRGRMSPAQLCFRRSLPFARPVNHHLSRLVSGPTAEAVCVSDSEQQVIDYVVEAPHSNRLGAYRGRFLQDTSFPATPHGMYARRLLGTSVLLQKTLSVRRCLSLTGNWDKG